MKIFITVIITVVAILAILAGIGLWAGARFAKSKALATKVRIESPARGDLVEIVAAPGSIVPKTKVSISARVSARIEELPHKEGDRVTKGNAKAEPPVPPSVLVRLDATDLDAALRSAEARRAARAAEIKVAQAGIASQAAHIEGIRASLAEAQRDLIRQAELLKSGDVPQSLYDQAKCRVDELKAQLDSAMHTLKSQELNLDVTRHQLEASDAEIAQAKDKLSYMTITSPIDGVVTRLNAEVGELVVTGTMNNPGTVIMEVADLSKMLVVAQVDESDVGGVQPGQRAIVRIRAYPDEEFDGRVDSVALTGTSKSYESMDFRVEIALEMRGRRVYSGLTADVDIETHRHRGILKIPSQAVLSRRTDELPAKIREDNANLDKKKTFAPVVYCCRDGKAAVTPVVVGPSDATHSVIRSGLSETDRIITGPYKVLEKLKHDQKVKDEREGPATQPAQTRPAEQRKPQTSPAETAPAG